MAQQDLVSALSISSDEDGGENIQGPKRLVEDPDSPTSRLLSRIAQISIRDGQLGVSPQERKFSYTDDIDRNPKISHAARLEAASGHSTPLGTSAGQPFGGGYGNEREELPYVHHDADIDRQEEIIEALDRDAELESKLNQEMAHVMIGRVQSGRGSAEKVLSLLQAFLTAETAFSQAMKAIGEIKLSGQADGATLTQALDTFVQLPEKLGEGHEKASKSTVPSINLIRDIVSQLRLACSELKQGSVKVQISVDASRKALKSALAIHKEVCMAFDASILEKNRFGSKSRDCESDPWIAEGRLIEKQAALRKAQAAQRQYLAGAFRRVGELERQRISVTRMTLLNCVQNMTCSISQNLQSHANVVTESLESVNGESDLESFTTMAADSVKGGDSLSERQTQMILYLWRQLLGSSEIVIQGALNRLDPMKKVWVEGYGVLTKAGFLHWFLTSDGDDKHSPWGSAGGPTLSINLARCEFEQGAAPSWRIIESSGMRPLWLGSRNTMQTYSTIDVESCMHWTAELKDTIANSRPK